jgi:PleD family two-component response regulator
MPNIITPSKELVDRAQGRLRMLLIVSRQSTSHALVSALAHTIPALLVLVNSSSEALEVTEAIKPDAFVLESAFWDELSGVELYQRLHAQPALRKIPAVLIGTLDLEQRHLLAKQKVVNLPYPVEFHDLQSVLETQLNIPNMPVRPNAAVIFEYDSSPVA